MTLITYFPLFQRFHANKTSPKGKSASSGDFQSNSQNDVETQLDLIYDRDMPILIE